VSYSEILRKRTDDDQRQQDERMLEQASKEQQDKVKTEFREIKNRYARLQELYNDIEPVLESINFTLEGRRIKSFYRNKEIQDVMSKRAFEYLLQEIFNMKDKDADHYQKQLSNSIGKFAMSTPDGSFTLEGTDESTVSVGTLGKNLKELANSDIDGVPFEKAIEYIYRKTFGQQLIRSREELKEKRENLRDMKKLLKEIGKTRRTGRKLPKDFKDVDIKTVTDNTYVHKTKKDRSGRPEEISEKEYKNLSEKQKQEYKRKTFLEGDVAELDDKFAISTAKKLVEQIEKNFAPTTYKGFEEFNLLETLPENPEEFIRKKFNNLRDTLELEIQRFLLNKIEKSKTMKKERKSEIETRLSVFTDKYDIDNVGKDIDSFINQIDFDAVIEQSNKNREAWENPKSNAEGKQVKTAIKNYEKILELMSESDDFPLKTFGDKGTGPNFKPLEKSNTKTILEVLQEPFGKVFEKFTKKNKFNRQMNKYAKDPSAKATVLLEEGKPFKKLHVPFINKMGGEELMERLRNFSLEDMKELEDDISKDIDVFDAAKEMREAFKKAFNDNSNKLFEEMKKTIDAFLEEKRKEFLDRFKRKGEREEEREGRRIKITPKPYTQKQIRQNLISFKNTLYDDKTGNKIEKLINKTLELKAFRNFDTGEKGEKNTIRIFKENIEDALSQYKKYELSENEKIEKARKLLKDMFSQPNDDDPEFKQNSEVAIKVREYEEKFIGVLEAYNELIVNNDVAEIATVKDTIKQLSIFVKDPREIQLKPLKDGMFTYDKEKVLRKIITKINAITDTTGLIGRKTKRATKEIVSEKKTIRAQYEYSFDFSQKVFDRMFNKDNFEEQIINHLDSKVFTAGVFPSLKPTADALVRQVKELVEYDIQERIPLGPLREGEERDLNLNEQIKGVIRKAIERTKEGIAKLESKNADSIEKLSKGEGIEKEIRNVIASRNNVISQFTKDIEQLEKYIGE
tara:strand:+ start:24 stop:2924 length:2901 start_codon:yes stop_codon:yes gene_type:complete